MNRYIEAKPTVSAVQFWNNEKCMLELKELGISNVDLRVTDGVTKMVVTNPIVGEIEANEGDYVMMIDDTDGLIVVVPQEYFDSKYRPYEASEASDDSNHVGAIKTPATDFPLNRLLNAFPRPEALNELYAIGPVDYIGRSSMYSVWRGNHSIMGLSGILFQIGKPGELGEQEGLEETDLLEIAYDRLSLLADDDCNIHTALIQIECAIGNLAVYEKRRRETGEASEY